MTILMWIIFGLILGIIANMVDPQPSEGGILGAMLLGICGAFLGGFLATIILHGAIINLTFMSFLLALLGSFVLLLLGRVVKRV